MGAKEEKSWVRDLVNLEEMSGRKTNRPSFHRSWNITVYSFIFHLFFKTGDIGNVKITEVPSLGPTIRSS